MILHNEYVIFIQNEKTVWNKDLAIYNPVRVFCRKTCGTADYV